MKMHPPDCYCHTCNLMGRPATVSVNGQIGDFLTAEKLQDKLKRLARPGSIVRMYFALDADTHQPNMATLQLQHVTGEVTDLWVWGEFDIQEVTDRHA
mgnify:CR=1 FL=1